jgi:transcriptional regulator GlxA family with amidase domain
VASVCVLLLFDGCDVLDVTGPYEVLLTANRLAARAGDDAPFDVRTVTVDGAGVTAYGGLGLVPSHGRLAEQRGVDVLVVPGLVDLEAGLADTVLLDALSEAADHAAVAASVCTGSFLLDAAGIVGDREVTTHWEDVVSLAARREAAGEGGAVRDDVRWVDAGDVVTAGGLSDGIDMALHLVERLVDHELATATARQLDHVWTEHR